MIMTYIVVCTIGYVKVPCCLNAIGAYYSIFIMKSHIYLSQFVIVECPTLQINAYIYVLIALFYINDIS